MFQAAGFANREEYRAAHGSDLYMTDIEAYDRICKVRARRARKYSLREQATCCFTHEHTVIVGL